MAVDCDSLCLSLEGDLCNMTVGMAVCDVAVSVAEVAAEGTVHVDIAGGMAMAVADVDVAVDAAADVDVNNDDVDSDRITSNIWLSSSHEGSLMEDFDCVTNAFNRL